MTGDAPGSPHYPASSPAAGKMGLAEGVTATFMSMNWIEFTTTTAGDPVALKIGVPHDYLFTEMKARRAFDGQSRNPQKRGRETSEVSAEDLGSSPAAESGALPLFFAG